LQRASEERRVLLLKQLDPDKDRRLTSLLPFARNVVVAPLTAEGNPIGALILEGSATGAGHIERRVVDMISQFSAHMALALSNAWLYERVQRMAETDALTGIPNRRTFETVLDRELSRSERTGEPLTLAMFDIDHFKNLNDTYGHQAGDEVLKAAAAALREACRDFDTPARYGGEEFVVVLPSCSVKESLAVAERLRQSLGAIEIVAKVTASAGVASFPNHASDAAGLIKAADEALYESKRGGRDRVTRSRKRAPRSGRIASPETESADI
jgi:diguanylate cyclase (GGDEF)-like protein